MPFPASKHTYMHTLTTGNCMKRSRGGPGDLGVVGRKKHGGHKGHETARGVGRWVVVEVVGGGGRRSSCVVQM